MAAADNSRFLFQAAADRHRATVVRAHDAIEALDRAGHAVTFCAVADAASVSRSWLYRHPDIRDLITRLRSGQSRSTAPATQRASNESLRQRLDAARAEITHLRAETTRLRDQLARQLGEQRARHPGNIEPR
jgi:HAMP domain-containing protein